MKTFLSAVLVGLFAVCSSARGQEAPAAYRLVVSYDRPGLQVPHWQITLPPRGPATYTGKPDKGIDPGEVTFRVSDAGRAKLGSLLDRSKGLQPCETKTKNLANMGQKDVAYTPAQGAEVHCTFNYTDNKPLGEALEYVLAMVSTVQAGLDLERLHRFDRLGLDPVMVRLADDAKAGHAVEMGAIRPTLESLASDEALLDRVRSRAAQLLRVVAQQDSARP